MTLQAMLDSERNVLKLRFGVCRNSDGLIVFGKSGLSM